MNRRNFFSTLLTATAGFMILPSAGRIWKAVKQPILVAVPNPDYVNAPYEEVYFLTLDNGDMIKAVVTNDKIEEIPAVVFKRYNYDEKSEQFKPIESTRIINERRMG